MNAQELAAALEDIEHDVTTGPWKHDTTMEGWMVATLGCDMDNNADHYVVTDNVPVSQMVANDPAADAQMIALCRNHLRLIIDSLRLAALQEAQL